MQMRTASPKLPLLSPSSSSSSSSSTMIRVLLIVSFEVSISLLCGKYLASALPDYGAPRPPPAMFAFGDSVRDTGNNNNLSTVFKCKEGNLWEGLAMEKSPPIFLVYATPLVYLINSLSLALISTCTFIYYITR